MFPRPAVYGTHAMMRCVVASPSFGPRKIGVAKSGLIGFRSSDHPITIFFVVGLVVRPDAFTAL